MTENLTKQFRAYKLVRYRDPKNKKWEKSRGWVYDYENGMCYLQLIAEEETMDLLYATVPPIEMYFEGHYGIVKPFYLEKRLKFEGMYGVVGDKEYGYHTLDLENCDCSFAFNRIYRTYDESIILTIDSWYASQMRDTKIYFGGIMDGKYYFMNYDVEFLE